MNLAKAKEIIQDLPDRYGLLPDQDSINALKLAIEAITYIELLRQTDSQNVPTLFYGETDD